MKDETGEPKPVTKEELDAAKDCVPVVALIERMEKMSNSCRKEVMDLPNLYVEITNLLGLSRTDRERRTQVEMLTALFGR